MMPRRKTYEVRVGEIAIGGRSPIRVQSMTNTDTADVEATTRQVKLLAEAGSELVRITVNNEAAAAAVPAIHEKLIKQNIPVPLVGDFHYNGHRLLSDFPETAMALAKYRINPGNVGFGAKHETQFAEMIEIAMRHNKPVRIGVNWGSLDQQLLARMLDENAQKSVPLTLEEVSREAIITSALESAAQAVSLGMKQDHIILSAKVSRPLELIAIYRELAKRCQYPLHLGLTEAGLGIKGTVASSAAMGVLLADGIGDTIRVSLTPEPGGNRAEEVRVAQEILQSLSLRHFVPEVTACPGCGRTTSEFFQHLAKETENFLRTQMPIWEKNHPGVETMNVAVMGCIVNGPGESKHANIGISLPGTGESPIAPVFADGQKVATLRGDNIAEEFKAMIADYVEKTYRANATKESA